MRAWLIIAVLVSVRLILTSLVGFVLAVRAAPWQLVALTVIPMVVDTVCAYTLQSAKKEESNGDE